MWGEDRLRLKLASEHVYAFFDGEKGSGAHGNAGLIPKEKAAADRCLRRRVASWPAGAKAGVSDTEQATQQPPDEALVFTKVRMNFRF